MMESPKSPKTELDKTLVKSNDEEEDSLEVEYEDLLMHHHDMLSEVNDKRSELLELQAKCEQLENAFYQEHAEFEVKRQQWMKYKDEVLQFVRDADAYVADANEDVKVINEEKLVLEGKLTSLEEKLGNLLGAGEPQPLSDLNNAPELPSSSDEPTSSDSKDSSCSPSAQSHGDNKENDHQPLKYSDSGNSLKRLSDKNSKASEALKLHDSDSMITQKGDTGVLKFLTKRNALLNWCQTRTEGYNLEILDFSKSWSDGMALNALLHSYLPDLIPFEALSPENREENFKVAFKAAEAASIPSSLTIADVTSGDRPEWDKVMNYIKDIYSVLEDSD